MTASRKSKQREIILENLLSRYDHPTAEEVYRDVRKLMPKISLATVYRNLNHLCDDGVIRSVMTKDVMHYDAHMNPHRHVICNKCGKIFDIDVDVTDEILGEARKNFNGEIENCKLIFYGLCDDCLNKK